MRQLQGSVRWYEGIPTRLQSNRDMWWLVKVYNGSDCNRFRNTADSPRERMAHMRVPGSAGHKPGSADDKPGSTLNDSRAVWENNSLIPNNAGASGYHIYYIIFNHFQHSWIQFVFSSRYQYCYPSTHGISGQAALGACKLFQIHLIFNVQWFLRYTPRPPLNKCRDALGDCYRAYVE